jgi:hypothetical protein
MPVGMAAGILAGCGGGGSKIPDAGTPKVPSPANATAGTVIIRAASAIRPICEIIPPSPANRGDCGRFMVNEA